MFVDFISIRQHLFDNTVILTFCTDDNSVSLLGTDGSFIYTLSLHDALPISYADEVHEHTSVYQLNELDFMYRQLSSDMQEEYVSLLTVFENLEALYICRSVITVYPNCKSMIDVAKQKLMNDPTFKHLSEDCQAYYFDFEAYASHLQEHGKFLVTEHGIFELAE